MRKTNFLILLVIISLTSCSREEEKGNVEKQYSLNYIQQARNQNLQKEFFDLQLESAEDRLKEKDKIEQKNVYDFRNIVYKTTEFDYSIYLEGPEMDYQNFNKNGNYLIFPLYCMDGIYDNMGIYRTTGYIDDDKNIDIFKYKNEIYVIPNNIESDYYYIDLKNMYFFVSLENTKAKEKFESIPIEYRCKISIQDDNKIKFYDEICEKRIKEMLKMDFQK